MNEQGPTWVSVFHSTHDRDIRENALVLRASGIDHQVVRGLSGYDILVIAPDESRASEEIAAYAAENRDWQTPEVVVPMLSDGWVGSLCYAIVLLLVAVLAQRNAFGADWLDVGRTQAGLIRHGQVWRTVTALCLHADLIHLLGNLFFGSVVGLFAGRLLGSGRAWFLILVAGAAGNLCNALLRPAEHTSIGASTSVFAGLGLLASIGWSRRSATNMNRLERWVPIAGSIALLGLLGTGEGRTDIAAHGLGFLCGVAGGLLFKSGSMKKAVLHRCDAIFAIGAIALLVLCWGIAINLAR